MTIEQWEKKGTYYEVNGKKIFVIDTGRGEIPNNKPVLVILHGFPTDSHDYHYVIDKLAQKYRVIVHDHLGFGLSAKPKEFSYSLLEQTDYALMLWKQMGIESFHIFSHDYGTSIATEIVARSNMGLLDISPKSIVLCNGTVHIELAKLRLMQKLMRNKTIGPILARLSPKWSFKATMRNIWSDAKKLKESDLDSMWELMKKEEGLLVMPMISQFTRDRSRYWHRWVGALQNTKIPLAFLWGTEDPIATLEIARVHHNESKGSRLVLLENTGHYPMIESPEKWSDELIELVDGYESASIKA